MFIVNRRQIKFFINYGLDMDYLLHIEWLWGHHSQIGHLKHSIWNRLAMAKIDKKCLQA